MYTKLPTCRVKSKSSWKARAKKRIISGTGSVPGHLLVHDAALALRTSVLRQPLVMDKPIPRPFRCIYCAIPGGGEKEKYDPSPYPFVHGLLPTICPESSDPFYILTYYINCVTTSWTHSMCKWERERKSEKEMKKWVDKPVDGVVQFQLRILPVINDRALLPTQVVLLYSKQHVLVDVYNASTEFEYLVLKK